MYFLVSIRLIFFFVEGLLTDKSIDKKKYKVKKINY